MTFSSLEEVKMMGFPETEELNSGAGLERSLEAGRLAEAQRSSLGPPKGTAGRPAEDGGEMHPGSRSEAEESGLLQRQMCSEVRTAMSVCELQWRRSCCSFVNCH